jgi:uncharacterized protein (DUF697 family)
MTFRIPPDFWENLIDSAYNRVLTGTKGIDKASVLALKYSETGLTLDQQAQALIKRQRLLAGSSGFITGLGGLMSLPVAIPANMFSVVFIQLRMIAAIAYMGGYDIEDKKVRSMILTCLAGNAFKDILQEIGINAGTRITHRLISNISEKSLIAINQKVGFALVAKSSGSGLVKLSKVVPLAGGIIGGSIDIMATNVIGRAACRLFLNGNTVDELPS